MSIYHVSLIYYHILSICDPVLCDLCPSWWIISPFSSLIFILPFSSLLSLSIVSSSLSPSLPLFLSVACNDLVASGRDRKPNALVQVAVIDPHKQHLVSHACTEIVEVRQHTYTHTCTILSLALSDLWCLLFCCVSGSPDPGWCSLHLCPSISVCPPFSQPFPPTLDSLNWNRQWALTFYFLWQSRHLKALVCDSKSVPSLSMYSILWFCVCWWSHRVRVFFCSLTSLNASKATGTQVFFFLGGNSCPLSHCGTPTYTHLCTYTHTDRRTFFFPFLIWRKSFLTHIIFPANPVKLNYHNRHFQRLHFNCFFPQSCQGNSGVCVCVFEHVCVETQDVVGYCMLAQPALQTLRVPLEFWFHGCNVEDLELRIWTAFDSPKTGYVHYLCVFYESALRERFATL